jgi:hypothetical protein
VFDDQMQSFDLIHPNRKATPVELWADGQLVDRHPTTVEDGKRTIIYPEDEPLFLRFLASVPPPNPLQKLAAMGVGELAGLLTTWVVVFAVISVAGKCTDAAWQAVTGH